MILGGPEAVFEFFRNVLMLLLLMRLQVGVWLNLNYELDNYNEFKLI